MFCLGVATSLWDLNDDSLFIRAKAITHRALETLQIYLAGQWNMKKESR